MHFRRCNLGDGPSDPPPVDYDVFGNVINVPALVDLSDSRSERLVWGPNGWMPYDRVNIADMGVDVSDSRTIYPYMDALPVAIMPGSNVWAPIDSLRPTTRVSIIGDPVPLRPVPINPGDAWITPPVTPSNTSVPRTSMPVPAASTPAAGAGDDQGQDADGFATRADAPRTAAPSLLALLALALPFVFN